MSDLCVSVCSQLGWVGEIVAVCLIGARTLWLEHRRRQLVQESVILKDDKKQLENQIEKLSLRPPPMPPIVLNIPGLTVSPAAPTPQEAMQAGETELDESELDDVR